jgi:hypothetical protein
MLHCLSWVDSSNTALGVRITDELEGIWKEGNKAYSRCYPSTCLQRLRKTKRKLNQGSRCSRRDSNPHVCPETVLLSYDIVYTTRWLSMFRRNMLHPSSCYIESRSYKQCRMRCELRNSNQSLKISAAVPISLLATCFHAGPWTEDGGDMFLRHVGWLSTDYTVLYHDHRCDNLRSSSVCTLSISVIYLGVHNIECGTINKLWMRRIRKETGTSIFRRIAQWDWEKLWKSLCIRAHVQAKNRTVHHQDTKQKPYRLNQIFP